MNIRVNAVIEVAGSPKGFVEQTMAGLIEHLERKSVKVLKKTQHKAEKVDELFSTFTEVELEFEEFEDVLDFCFEFLPSHIEIEEPQHFEMRREDMADFFNDFLMRLHKGDMAAKDANAKTKLLEDTNRVLIKNLIAVALKAKPCKADELSKRVGIKEANLLSILETYKEHGLVAEKKGRYEWVK